MGQKEPSEKRAFLVSLIWILGIALGLLWPIFFGDQAIVQEFTFRHQYGPLAFIEEMSRAGTPSLWLPYYLSGYPFYLSAFAYFWPLTKIVEFFGFMNAFNILLFLSYFLGGVGVLRLTRSLGISTIGSRISAAAYMLFQLNIGLLILPFTLTLPVVPFFFLAILKLRERRYRYLLLGALSIAFGWQSGFGEYVLYTIIAGGCFALWLDIGGRSLRTASLTVGMVLLGTLLALPRLIPIANMLEISVRAGGAQGATEFFRLSDVVHLLFPYFSLPFANMIPYYHSNPFTIYVGTVSIILGILFFAYLRPIIRKDFRALYFGLLFLFGFLMMFSFTGLFFFTRAVTFSLFGGVWKLLFLAFFALAVLVGYGFDYLESRDGDQKLKRVVYGYAASVLLVSLVILAAKIVILFFENSMLERLMDLIQPRLESGAAPAKLERIARNFWDQAVYNVSFKNYHFVVAYLLLILPVFPLFQYLKKKMNLEQLGAWLLGILALGGIFLWQGYYPLVPKSLITSEPLTSQYVKTADASKNFRVFRFWPGLRWYQERGLSPDNYTAQISLEKELLFPNINIVYGIPIVDGDDNFMSSRQSRLSAEIGSIRAPQNEDKKWILEESTSLKERLARFTSAENRSLLSVFGVKYIVTSLPFPPPFEKVFEASLAGTAIPIYIYKNEDAKTSAYFAKKVAFVTTDNDSLAWEALLAQKDFGETTVIECTDPRCYGQPTKVSNSSITILESRPGYLRLHIKMDTAQWLVHSESNLPTWEAILRSATTSQSLPIFTANYIHQAVPVPVGTYEVVFSYPRLNRQFSYAVSSLLEKLFRLDDRSLFMYSGAY
ncbi:MAG: hypothetical protein A2665_01040 [Candidatus Zambryskibacteria bacterium RIFCSPHIGHO2_01_FULL_46_30]|uniref:Membrane protein 6-pyruvoyl-tetrahydropterin synthase-related domain-containing protein n=1 Tax=Candidatus Zambryskibacteria bacterium RIFCSPHIGHO2_01_FULL_46_30 TaxID=1802739 RepID=A0A1G2T3A5_9BACT|nr:MAG: hypothetical protein A2665_01040 [Candidatus Zambryskibacteria bacterium RIFCSPHIGHO2_01_FULL_46_30]OHB06099.1 MAG: hypothetical protein A3B22_02270 [Candidatus Zambryskibacteria bacterium RIFCSPLOWO2_01_FULL_47_33]